jgi:hypothetical protein
MQSHKILPSAACVVAIVMLVGLMACGSPTSATTTPPSAPASTGGPAASTATPETQAYVTAFTAFMGAFANAPDTSFLNITDPATATAADLKAADEASTFIHRLLDRLNAMKPPAQVKSLHDSFAQVFKGEVATMDEFIKALKDKDAAKMKTAHDALIQNVSQIEPVLTQIGTALGLQ